MLTKTVLRADDLGACRLVEVPFEWQHGDALPPGTIEYWFPTAAAALNEMANRGRAQQRVHVAQPPPRSGQASDPEAHLPPMMRRSTPPATPPPDQPAQL